jgi:ribosomal protein L37E
MTESDSNGSKIPVSDAACHRCGRYIGPVSRCPHCGAAVRQRMSLRVFRWAAVLLATLGLALLYVMSITRAVPRVEIGSISNTMNFAYVNLEGVAPQSARVYRRGDIVSSVGFTLDDGSGRIPVRAFGRRAQELADSGRLPQAGDRVSLDGSLNVSAEETTIYLQVPESLVILERRRIESAPLGEISRAQIGELVDVNAVAQSVTPPANERQPWLIELADDSGSLPLVVWPRAFEFIADRDSIAAGAGLELRAEVSEYRDELRLELKRGEDLRVVQPGMGQPAIAAGAGFDETVESAADSVRIEELAPTDEGRLVSIVGSIGRAVKMKGGSCHMLYQGDEKIKMVLWDSQFSDDMRTRLRSRVELVATGRLNLYDSELELVPRGEYDIKIMAPPDGQEEE